MFEGFLKMKNISKVLLVISMLFSLNTIAADASAGKSLYAKCVACHGQNGEGNPSQKAPRIAGQHDWYIYSSLVAFKQGERKNPTMLPFIKNPSDKDYQDLAAYISQIK